MSSARAFKAGNHNNTRSLAPAADWSLQCSMSLDFAYVVNICPVIIVERPHPFPFRTRKLSSLTPMVLPSWRESRSSPGFFLFRGIYFVAPPFVTLDVR